MTVRVRRPQPLRSRPTASVVVPCYNYGHFLPAAVHSALDQPGVDVEVIVVDDCSTDGSADVARRLAGADPRVRVLEHASNRGHIATYNDGLAAVTGDYVVLLSADDVLPPAAITRSVALMEHHRSVGLVYGFPLSFLQHPPAVRARASSRSWTVWHGSTWLRRSCRTGRNPIMSPEVVMRREAWEEIGSYDDRLPHAADMAVWLNTALRWDIGRVNGPTQAWYRVHGDNMHFNHAEGLMLRDLRERRRVFELLFLEGRPVPADAKHWHLMARKALAREALRHALGRGSFASEVSDVQPFLELARETWPGVTTTPLWRRARRAGNDDPVSERALRRTVRINRAVAWRLWRRYG